MCCCCVWYVCVWCVMMNVVKIIITIRRLWWRRKLSLCEERYQMARRYLFFFEWQIIRVLCVMCLCCVVVCVCEERYQMTRYFFWVVESWRSSVKICWENCWCGCVDIFYRYVLMRVVVKLLLLLENYKFDTWHTLFLFFLSGTLSLSLSLSLTHFFL